MTDTSKRGEDGVAEVKRKKVTLEDDFFSLSGFERKKKKKKKTGESHGSSSPGLASDVVVVQPEVVSVQSQSDSAQFAPGVRSLDRVKEKKALAQINGDSVNELGSAVDSDGLDLCDLSPSPVIDREAIRQAVAQRIMSQSHGTSDKETPMLDEDEDEEDLEFAVVDLTTSPPSGQYVFKDENERQRSYIVSVTDKLHSPASTADFGTKGTKSFTKILLAVVAHFKQLHEQKLSKSLLSNYDADQCSLIWIEGKMEIKPFFKPSTLRVAPPDSFDVLQDDVANMTPTMLRCLLIPKENASNFLKVYEEFASNKPAFDIDTDALVAETVNGESSEDDLPDISVLAEAPVDIEEVGDSFIIGLKGKDNKREEVRVTADTKIMSLLTYFCDVKGIDIAKIDIGKAKLIFDDEVLDVNGVVGDTELEEDYEVQVVINDTY